MEEQQTANENILDRKRARKAGRGRGEFLCVCYKEKKSHQQNLFFLISVVATRLYMKQCVLLRSKKRQSNAWSTDS